jgi:homoserine O-acetyltransferase
MLNMPLNFADIEVELPPELERCGSFITARISGNRNGPVIAALGGISGDRFVCRSASGGPGWWRDLVGDGRAVDPARHLVVGIDYAADPGGRWAPSTMDQARVLAAVLVALGAERFDAIVGASYGGMVALSFAEQFPCRIGKLAVISAAAEPHPAATAVRELQRRVVALGLELGRGEEALSIARGIAMLTYRTPEEFADRFRGGLDERDPLASSDAGAYLRSRGEAFRSVMSPQRFLSLSASIDLHRVDPGRIRAAALLVGATSDQLVPSSQMLALSRALGGKSALHLRDSRYGHDMFLKEASALGRLIDVFFKDRPC